VDKNLVIDALGRSSLCRAIDSRDGQTNGKLVGEPVEGELG